MFRTSAIMWRASILGLLLTVAVNVKASCSGGAVNGQWSDWSEWMNCSAACGGGIQSRSRNCDNPAPSNGGVDCQGNSTEERTCNTQACPTFQDISTGTDTNYIPSVFDLSRQCYIEFEVQACGNALVNLMAGDPNVDELDTYLILIFAASVVIGNRGGNNLATVAGYHLNCTEKRRFWISWGPSNFIRVGTPNELIIEYEDPAAIYPVNGISVATSSTTGEWRIYNPELLDGQTVITNDEYGYIPVCFDYTHASHVTFEVQACHDAHINLMADVRNDIDTTYEIVIGGHGDTKAIIRKVKQGSDLAVASGLTYLNCHESLLFSVFWTNQGEILVASPDLWFLSYCDSTPYNITGISVSTGFSATGKWRVYKDRPLVRELPPPPLCN